VTDLLVWLAAALAGGMLAVLHLGGLWVTVRRLPASRHRVLLTVGSFLLRVVLVGVGFVLVLGGDRDPARLLAALAGFVVVRTVLVWRVRRGAPAAAGSVTSPGSASSTSSAPPSEVQP
jgi:F1F0 ATPase subunit 2